MNYNLNLNIRSFSCIYALILLVSCANPADEKQDSETPNGITEQQLLQHLSNRNDSSVWDLEIFYSDLENIQEKSTGPFKVGIFPEPKYDLIGEESFTGVGSFGLTGSGNNYKEIKENKILYNSFYVKENSLNKKRLDGNSDEIFFQILVLTDSIDVNRFSHLSSHIISRNHPDYIGQGYFLTKNNRIDYSAFITVQNDSYAIISTRLFNLKYGKTILIAPQKDGSLRSRQIKSPSLSSKGIDQYTDELLKKKEIIEFFTAGGNI